jgi:hypothetical protein
MEETNQGINIVTAHKLTLYLFKIQLQLLPVSIQTPCNPFSNNCTSCKKNLFCSSCGIVKDAAVHLSAVSV